MAKSDFWCPKCKERFSWKGEGNPKHCGYTSKRVVKYKPEPKEYYESEKKRMDKMRLSSWMKEGEEDASV